MPTDERHRLKGPLRRRLKDILGPDRLLTDAASLLVYESDALTHFHEPPLAVALPRTTEQVAQTVRALFEAKIPFTPRGAGTGLSGGALPPESGGVLIDTCAMDNVLEVLASDRMARVQPGVVNLDLSLVVKEWGLMYAPDPSSQMACTLGGNVAENSSGPHSLLYGPTSAHILGATVVMEDGEILQLGGPHPAASGPDLLGSFAGSEGTLGIVTELWVKLLPKPLTVATLLGSFVDLPAACRVVSRMIAEGVRASAIEALDRLTIEAVESSVFAAGYPKEAGAVLLVELHGHPLDVEHDGEVVRRIFREGDALEIQEAEDEEHRKRLWRGRKGAYGAMGRVAPDLYVMDTVVPRSKLEEAIRRITDICARHGLRLANVFHAGEGNLHPNISYDRRDADELARVLAANREIVEVCLGLGGALSGEHGIGVEKRAYMKLQFNDDDLAAFEGFRRAWSPELLLNPGKLLPTPRACAAVKGKTAHLPDAERGA